MIFGFEIGPSFDVLALVNDFDFIRLGECDFLGLGAYRNPINSEG